jgi:hypothetical protein
MLHQCGIQGIDCLINAQITWLILNVSNMTTAIHAGYILRRVARQRFLPAGMRATLFVAWLTHLYSEGLNTDPATFV